ncbi:peroxiredoxin-like family protein [Algibacter miyuki]|uniref:thioredoxin-dependent peroxiredoxin n=1 Tax=Algibacter miyuki TaxID=1306933 RepID=A0ABV5H013_9FLAO|nr:peroxiredoxin-like family protein [Algibacter miyuki]MDN3667508.1 peroxiredoxin-like family protein [Algibacter miyuki]
MNTTEHNTLQDALRAKQGGWEAKATEAQKTMTADNLDAIIATHFKDNAINVGDKAIDFSLKNALGACTNLQDTLSKGPVILTWYRGGWCPYCNLTLQFLQKSLPEFEKYGAKLLALTPELPDKSLSTSEKHHLKFEVLSDVGNKVAKQYGLSFKLTDALAEVYKNGVGLQNYNGDDSSELPITTTYVIDKNGVVQYAFLDADYRKRASITDIIAVLKTL